MNSAKMYFSLLILLCLIGAVTLLEITASYRTSFQCSNGSYALIGGANLTLEYNYGYKYSQLQSFHLYEVFTGRHMFDYETYTGKAFIKDRGNRLKSYEWTDTGIKFMIPDINKNLDLGKYVAEVETEHNYKRKTIEIKQIFDPPVEVILNTPGSLHSINLTEGFGEYVLIASSESYVAITCNSVKIIWMSSKKEELLSCRAKDYKEATVSLLTLKESEMTAGECIRLEVYAEQYGVSSEKKVFDICYVESQGSSVHGTKADGFYILLTQLIPLVVTGGVLFVVSIVIVKCQKMKSRGHISQRKSGRFQSVHKAVDSLHCAGSSSYIRETALMITKTESNKHINSNLGLVTKIAQTKYTKSVYPASVYNTV